MDMNPTAAFLPVVNKKKEEIYIEACFHHEKKEDNCNLLSHRSYFFHRIVK